MDNTVSIADVERKLSFILRGASEGRSYVVVSNGRPMARIVPADAHDLFPRSRAALLSRLKQQPVVAVGNWTRDDTYDD
ncbi:type II toxin-antitoxin system prevent-host-death family antitoxin [Mesorhizobium sp. B2-9-1]|uniref:type II toxin-antitoxin system Phd/YefM family antitoxin n=1 Tax=unclassified Mesorhizobium TaxID=325217 RepID=UPI00112B1F58|nr:MULTISPECIES: type II toxin-antitoxin system prevent-host-death family antitoxin [unclassified Mesorhizobium]TPI45909.1 type II toxin-antitoxin system prevent-host-death family antitoxin [Mesorhizobium sp. B2-9-1]TPJ28038.1 type II toxin-antitoxin system prevent-host-death family antitoxin [Mesorhizobium sp. B2-7-2]TPO13034.1 type II toxin-antitoxin system prevent-host-death family antitoxin [Mesorhizobium sp. B1-1-5]